MTATVPHNGTATSREAADSMKPHTERLRYAVWCAIDKADIDGLTCDECEQRLGMSHQTCSARIHELMKKQMIVSAGRRRTRSGRSATVWIVP